MLSYVPAAFPDTKPENLRSNLMNDPYFVVFLLDRYPVVIYFNLGDENGSE